MDSRTDGLTLDQMAIFVAVVEEGSFSGAARRMNRAQSAITYGVQNLELQTGTGLFDRSSYRPTLTAAGIALLPRARRVLESLTEYRKQAHNLVAGMEAKLTLALDVAAPQEPVIEALKAFKDGFPMVEVAIFTQPLEQTLAMVGNGDADLAVIIEAPVLSGLEALERVSCGAMTFITVAAPEHPLAQMAGPIAEADLREHMQLLLSSGTEVSGTTDIAGHAINRWRVNDLGLRRRMLLEGLGWGGMPDHIVADDIQAGRLVVLPLDTTDSSQVRLPLSLSVTHLKSRALGPAGRWLSDRLSQGR